jgi:hypothetical protein
MTFNQLQEKIFQNYQAGAISDEQLVQLIDQAMSYLGAKTLAAFAKQEDVDYNVIKKRKQRLENPLYTFNTGGVEFVKDNEWPPLNANVIIEPIRITDFI